MDKGGVRAEWKQRENTGPSSYRERGQSLNLNSPRGAGPQRRVIHSSCNPFFFALLQTPFVNRLGHASVPVPRQAAMTPTDRWRPGRVLNQPKTVLVQQNGKKIRREEKIK